MFLEVIVLVSSFGGEMAVFTAVPSFVLINKKYLSTLTAKLDKIF